MEIKKKAAYIKRKKKTAAKRKEGIKRKMETWRGGIVGPERIPPIGINGGSALYSLGFALINIVLDFLQLA